MTDALTMVVMAAGMGSRYGGLKQVEGFGPHGETLLEYSLFDARLAGFRNVVFVIRRDIEAAFRERVVSRLDAHFHCTCVFQELDALPAPYTPPQDRTKPWGTGHAVLVAREAVKTPFAVINADDFYGRDAFARLAGFLRQRTADEPTYALAGFRLDKTLSASGGVARGVCEADGDGRLLRITEHMDIHRSPDGGLTGNVEGSVVALPGDSLVSMNLWGFTPAFFDSLSAQFTDFLAASGGEMKREFYLPAAVDADIQAGRATATVLPVGSQWFGVTYPEDRETVARAILSTVAAGEYPSPLFGR